MNKKSLFNHLIFFIVALITLISASFAWFAMSKIGHIGGIDGNIGSSMGRLKLEVMRNGDEDFQEIKEHSEMIELFDLTKPGDFYIFRITYLNDSTEDRILSASIFNVANNPVGAIFDIRDVFYLDYISIINDGTDISNESSIEPNSDDIVVLHGQELHLYRLNNLLDDTNNVRLFEEILIEKDKEAIVTFKIVYDVTTTNINYQYNALFFNSIFVFGK